MKRILIDRLDNLPTLPSNITKLNKFLALDSSEPEKLIEVIKEDPLMTTTILKVANSSIFGFRSNIDTLSRAINLLGINFTISIAIGTIVLNKVQGNLKAYNITLDKFIELSALASKIINTWISSIDFDLKEELLLPAFLQEIGKFIISELLERKGLLEDFHKELINCENIFEIENKFVGFSSSRITANMFKNWGFSHKLIFPIAFTDKIEDCPKDFLKHAQILNIVKILCDIRNPLGDTQIQKALEKANDFGFNEDYLLNAIDVINEEISSHS